MWLISCLLTGTETASSFSDLEWKQRNRLSEAFQNHSHSQFRLDRSAIVASRNRYANVQPWEGSRIKLDPPIGGSDYVNASPISLSSLPTPLRRGRRLKHPLENNSSDAQPVKPDETRYIATQGPKDGQFNLFWNMAFQQTTGDVGVIVMLTECYEGLKEKCGQYFPKNMQNPVLLLPHEPTEEVLVPTNDGDPFLESGIYSADADNVLTDQPADSTESAGETAQAVGAQLDGSDSPNPDTVQLISFHNDASTGSEIRELLVTIGGSSKRFHHFLFSAWPDYGGIEPEDKANLLQLTRESKRLAEKSPRIVHCSAGVGRTGTFIALDFLLRELEEGRLLDQLSTDLTATQNAQSTDQGENQDETGSRERRGTWGKSGPTKTTTPEPKDHDVIHDTVDLLRSQRMMMVINYIQYTSLYEILKEQFINKYAEKEIGVTVTPSQGMDVEGPSPKFRRTDTQSSVTASVNSMDIQEKARSEDRAKLNKAKKDEDTVSEAETEIEVGGDVKMATQTQQNNNGDDAYAIVSQETIMKELSARSAGRDGDVDRDGEGDGK
jgi:protein-tyrosine phosphatase